MNLRFTILSFLLAAVMLSGCAKEEQLPQIGTTHWEMPDAIQVIVQFKQFAEFKEKGETYKAFTFTIHSPEQYKGKEVSFSLNWKRFDSAKLIQGKKYLVTVPKDNIGTTDLICDWGLEYKQP